MVRFTHYYNLESPHYFLVFMVGKKEKYWSRYAGTYDNDVEYVVGKELREAISERLLRESELGDVIEFGCGTGYFTMAIAQRAKRVVATDLSDSMLEIARRQLNSLSNVTLQKDDCERSHFHTGSFDAVFMANVIHTVDEPDKVLSEGHRVLRPGGLLLITAYTDYGTDWFKKMELGIRYFQKFGMPPSCYRNYSPEGLAHLVEGQGFRIEEVQLLSDKARAIYLKARRQRKKES